MLHLLKILLLIHFIKAVWLECPFKEKKYNQSSEIIRHFNDLSQLEFTQCNESIIIKDWGLKPNQKLILDNTLNFKGLMINLINEIICIHLDNFNGFDLLSDPFKEIQFIVYTNKYDFWSIDSSNFHFYINNKLINEQECLNNNTNWKNFLTNSMIFSLKITSNSRYSKKTCSYIFKNTIIDNLFLFDIRSSYINSNILTFLNNHTNNDLNSNIHQVLFTLYRIQFDENLFNKEIFQKTYCLDLNGVLNGIQNDLFKYFNKLSLIRIRSQNVRQLFARNNKWIEYLNYNLKTFDLNLLKDYIFELLPNSILLIIDQTFPNLTWYNYPNEDFCLFSNFPHKKLVFPKLKPIEYSSCSCTELYLIQYSIEIQFEIQYFTGQVLPTYEYWQYYMDNIYEKKFSKCFANKMEFYNSITLCDFKQRLNKCNLKIELRNDEISYFEMLDWQEVSKISSLIFSVYLNSIFTLIVIILSALTLLIIRSKTVIKEKNPMYNFLFMNTILTMIYITIYAFRLIGICIENDFYCSPLNETKFNIYYKTILILFIGETLKSSSNFSYLSFSLSRYIKVTSTKLSFLLKFDQLKKRYYFLISLITATFINLYHLFEYNFNLTKNSGFLNSKDSFESFFKYSHPEYIDHFTTIKYYLLNIFFYLKLIFSDLSYIVLNVIVDLKLLSFVKIQNAKKVTITSKILSNNNNKRNKGDSTTNKITSMIILNGLNCFILRFPSALANMYGFIFRFDKYNKSFEPTISGYIVCRRHKICDNLQEILYFFYLISLLLQFFIFFKFDKIFHKGYNEIKTNFLKKIKKNNGLTVLVV
jgi:hypothetical protein